MSLFICSVCENIENTAMVASTIKENYIVDRTKCNEGYPNKHLQDMMEDSDKEHHNMMLCEYCNTGNLHGEFAYTQATQEEKELGAHSAYGMITPFDHDPDIIIRDDTAPHGYRAAKQRGITIKASPRRQVILTEPMDYTSAASLSYPTSGQDTANMRAAELKRMIRAAKKEPNPNKDLIAAYKTELDELKGR